MTRHARARNERPTFRAYRSAIRYVLRRLGLLAQVEVTDASLLQPWQSLLDALPDRFARMSLRGFMTFCASRGVAPNYVDDAVLQGFAEHLRTTDIRVTSWGRARRVARAWNKASETITGWPERRLGDVRSHQRRYSLPFTAYPTSLQEEIARFEARLRPATTVSGACDLFLGDGPVVPLRAGAVRSHLVALRLALAALVHSGTAPERISGLAMLLTRENRRTIIRWHYDRAGGRRSDTTAAIANVLRIIGKYHVKLEGAELTSLLADLKQAKPPRQKEMTSKNAARLRELEDPARTAALVCLPGRLIRLAVRTRDGWIDASGVEHAPQPKRAAWLATIAVAIEVLLHCPMRMANLAGLRLDVHLQDATGRGKRFTHILVEPAEVKNGARLEFPLERATADLIAVYLRDFRPLIAHPSSAWLFPSRDHADRSRNQSTFGTAITDTIREHVGVALNPQLFRAFAGALILEENPHAIDDLRAVLGHWGFETALKHYRMVSARGAARRLAAAVGRKRALRAGASGAPGRPLLAVKLRRRRS